MPTRRPQSSNCSREHTTSRREDDVVVRRLAPSNPDTSDKRCVTPVPSLTSLQSTMCWLGNLDENDIRERYHLMSVMLTTGLLVRCHPVALLLVPADLPARMAQQPCPDRFVRTKSLTIAKAHLALRANGPSLILHSLDSTLNRIGSRTVVRCRLQFHQFSGSSSPLFRCAEVLFLPKTYELQDGSIINIAAGTKRLRCSEVFQPSLQTVYNYACIFRRMSCTRIDLDRAHPPVNRARVVEARVCDSVAMRVGSPFDCDQVCLRAAVQRREADGTG